MPWNSEQKNAYDRTEAGKVRKKRYLKTVHGKMMRAEQQRRYRARNKLLRGPVALGRPRKLEVKDA